MLHCNELNFLRGSFGSNPAANGLVDGPVPELPLCPRIADQVDAQVKVVGLVPGPDPCSAAKAGGLFDHLIREHEQRAWHGQAKRLCGPEFDTDFQFGRRLNRQHATGRPTN
jgi:hypothetical protein